MKKESFLQAVSVLCKYSHITNKLIDTIANGL